MGWALRISLVNKRKIKGEDKTYEKRKEFICLFLNKRPGVYEMKMEIEREDGLSPWEFLFGYGEIKKM